MMVMMISPSAIICVTRIVIRIPVRIISIIWIIITACIPWMCRVVPVWLIPIGIQISRCITGMNINIMIILVIDDFWFLFLAVILIPIRIVTVLFAVIRIVFIVIYV